MLDLGCGVGEHLGDDDWLSTLRACRAALRPGGHLVFGARDPAGEPWLNWNAESTFERIDVAGVGVVQDWLEVIHADSRQFSFRWTFVFERDGATFNWEATFRVRSRAEIIDALQASELVVVDVRDDEFIFIARRV